MVKKINKVLFLYNPSSGKGKIKKNLGYIDQELRKKYGSVDIIESKSKSFMEDTIKKACYEYDYVFFSGGDGTFNIVINSIPDIENLPIFGYLPGGSTNDMSYNLNISKDIKIGLKDLLNSTPQEYNVGSIGDTKFIYVADFGAFTDVSHITPQEQKRKFGRLAYLKYAIEILFKGAKNHKVVVDGVVYETPLMFISNSREVGSFRINPEKSQKDGLYYIVIVNGEKGHRIRNIVYLFIFGIEAAVSKNRAITFTSSRFTLDCDVNEWDVDGEAVTIKFPVTCGYSGKKIRILTNR